jgi:hypothetical protein
LNAAKSGASASVASKTWVAKRVRMAGASWLNRLFLAQIAARVDRAPSGWIGGLRR